VGTLAAIMGPVSSNATTCRRTSVGRVVTAVPSPAPVVSVVVVSFAIASVAVSPVVVSSDPPQEGPAGEPTSVSEPRTDDDSLTASRIGRTQL
jgi:hypothetical protein